MTTPETPDMFGKKYDEFATDLLETYPELNAEIEAAIAIPENQNDPVSQTFVAASRYLSQPTMAEIA